MRTLIRRRWTWFGLCLLLALIPACATLRAFSALQQVQFSLDHVHRMELAGVNVDRIRSYEGLSVLDLLQIASAAAEGSMPLSFTAEMRADNPEGNPTARLMAMDWVLFLNGRETVQGTMDREIQFPPGQATGFPMVVSLDAAPFFREQGRDLVDLILGLVGAGGTPVGIRLEITPTVQTPLGPIRYPRPVILGN